MNDLPRVEMWCNECSDWVRCRMFYFSDAELFKRTVTVGNMESCPEGHLITHDKKYLRYIDKNGNITTLD
jgi:hypothetical protein